MRSSCFGIVPFVQRTRRVEALVALQPDQPRLQDRGQDLRAFGLSDAGRPLDQQRLLECDRQLDRCRKLLVDHVAVSGKALPQRCRGSSWAGAWCSAPGRPGTPAGSARCKTCSGGRDDRPRARSSRRRPSRRRDRLSRAAPASGSSSAPRVARLADDRREDRDRDFARRARADIQADRIVELRQTRSIEPALRRGYP